MTVRQLLVLVALAAAVALHPLASAATIDGASTPVGGTVRVAAGATYDALEFRNVDSRRVVVEPGVVVVGPITIPATTNTTLLLQGTAGEVGIGKVQRGAVALSQLTVTSGGVTFGSVTASQLDMEHCTITGSVTVAGSIDADGTAGLSFTVRNTSVVATDAARSSQGLHVTGSVLGLGLLLWEGVRVTAGGQIPAALVVAGRITDVANVTVSACAVTLDTTGAAASTSGAVRAVAFVDDVTRVPALSIVGTTVDALVTTGGSFSAVGLFGGISEGGAVALSNVRATVTTAGSVVPSVFRLGATAEDTDSILVAEAVANITAPGVTGAAALTFGSMSRVRSVSIDRCSVAVSCGSTANALVFTARLMTVTRCTITGATVTATASGATANALSFVSFNNVPSVVIEDTTATATAGATAAYAVAVAGRLDSAGLTVRRVAAVATAGTNTAGALYLGASASGVGQLLFLDTNATATTEAGGSTSAAFITGPIDTAEAVVFRGVRATATAKGAGTTGTTALYVGGSSGVTNFTVSGCTATADAPGGGSGVTAAALVHESSFNNGGVLLFEDTTAAATTGEAGARAAFIGGASNTGSVTMAGVTARGSAGGNTAEVGGLFGTVTSVGAVLFEDLDVGATAAGHTVSALRIAGRLTDVGSCVVVRSTATAAGAGSVFAATIGASSSNITTLRLEDVAVTATNTVHTTGAVVLPAITGHAGTTVVLRRVTATATGVNTVEAIVLGKLITAASVLLEDTQARASAAQAAAACTFLAVQEVRTLAFDRVVAVADTTAGLGAAVFFDGAVSDGHRLRFDTVTAVARGSTAQALSFSGRILTVRGVVARHVEANATGTSGWALAVNVALSVQSAHDGVVVGPNVTARASGKTQYSRAVYFGGVLEHIGGPGVVFDDVRAYATPGDNTGSALLLKAGASNSTALTITNTVAEARCPGTTCQALVVLSTVSDVHHILVENATATATAVGNTAQAVVIGARLERSPGGLTLRRVVAGVVGGSAPTSAVHFGPVTDAGPLLLDDVNATARCVNAGAQAVQFLGLTRVASVTVTGGTVEATGKSGAHVASFSGTMEDVPTVVVSGMVSTATATTAAATVLRFAPTIVDVGTILVEDSHLTASNGGSNAWVLYFTTSVDRVGRITFRAVTAASTASSSVAALQFIGAVRDVGGIDVLGCALRAEATTGTAATVIVASSSFERNGLLTVADTTAAAIANGNTGGAVGAEVLYFPAAFGDNAGVLVARTTATAHTGRSTYSRVLYFAQTLRHVGRILVEDSSLIATVTPAANVVSQNAALFVAAAVNTGSVLVVRSTLLSNNTVCSCGSLTDVAAFGVVNSTLSASNTKAGTLVALQITKAIRVATVLVARSTVAASGTGVTSAVTIASTGAAEDSFVLITDSVAVARSTGAIALAVATTGNLLNVTFAVQRCAVGAAGTSTAGGALLLQGPMDRSTVALLNTSASALTGPVGALLALAELPPGAPAPAGSTGSARYAAWTDKRISGATAVTLSQLTAASPSATAPSSVASAVKIFWGCNTTAVRFLNATEADVGPWLDPADGLPSAPLRAAVAGTTAGALCEVPLPDIAFGAAPDRPTLSATATLIAGNRTATSRPTPTLPQTATPRLSRSKSGAPTVTAARTPSLRSVNTPTATRTMSPAMTASHQPATPAPTAAPSAPTPAPPGPPPTATRPPTRTDTHTASPAMTRTVVEEPPSTDAPLPKVPAPVATTAGAVAAVGAVANPTSALAMQRAVSIVAPCGLDDGPPPWYDHPLRFPIPGAGHDGVLEYNAGTVAGNLALIAGVSLLSHGVALVARRALTRPWPSAVATVRVADIVPVPATFLLQPTAAAAGVLVLNEESTPLLRVVGAVVFVACAAACGALSWFAVGAALRLVSYEHPPDAEATTPSTAPWYRSCLAVVRRVCFDDMGDWTPVPDSVPALWAAAVIGDFRPPRPPPVAVPTFRAPGSAGVPIELGLSMVVAVGEAFRATQWGCTPGTAVMLAGSVCYLGAMVALLPMRTLQLQGFAIAIAGLQVALAVAVAGGADDDDPLLNIGIVTLTLVATLSGLSAAAVGIVRAWSLRTWRLLRQAGRGAARAAKATRRKPVPSPTPSLGAVSVGSAGSPGTPGVLMMPMLGGLVTSASDDGDSAHSGHCDVDSGTDDEEALLGQHAPKTAADVGQPAAPPPLVQVHLLPAAKERPLRVHRRDSPTADASDVLNDILGSGAPSSGSPPEEESPLL